MDAPKLTTYQNGRYGASPVQGEALPVHARRTVFPSDPPVLSVRTLLYNSSRTLLAGASLIRWLLFFLLIMAGFWAPGWLPGRWYVSILCLVLLVSVVVFLRRWRKDDFVIFVEGVSPALKPSRLTPDDKIAIHVTGYFSVEGKWQRFTWLPGFYRVFATRERALLCQVQVQRFLHLARWPADEVGMWYVFFMPGDVERVRWGELLFGREPRPSLAIDYRTTVPARSRLGKEITVTETVYLTSSDAADLTTILADLRYDLPPNVFTDNQSVATVRKSS